MCRNPNSRDMTDKEQYTAFCNRHPDMPVMMQPWWLEAVCAGKQWDVMLFTRQEVQGKKKGQAEDTDEIVAVLPYLLRKRLWYKFILMPQLTMFGGAWIDSDLQASPDLQKRLAKLISARLKAMHIAYYYQQYTVGSPMPHWLDKQWMKVEQRVTYRIDDLTDIGEVEEAFSKNKQRQIKKAGTLTVDYDMTAEEFYRFHTECIGERQRRLSYSREFLLVLERKARREGASQFIRVSEGGQTVAAAMVVYDRNYLYYLLPAYLPSAAKSGASALLAKEAILLAKEKNLRFDFEGGNDNEGIANHYKQFGSRPTTYFSVSKLYRPSFAVLLWLNKLQERMKKY